MAASSVDRRLQTIASLAIAGLNDRCYTAVSLIVGSPHENLIGLAAGLEQSRPVCSSTIFDLASLTKPLATASSVLLLAQRRRLTLSDPLGKFFPVIRSRALGALPVIALLTHTSGLPAWLDLHSHPMTRKERCARIFEQALTQPQPGYVYSDLGFMLLGEIVRKVSGASLAQFVRANVFTPLRMHDTRFVPPVRMRARCVPTQYCEVLGDHLCGIVHDENCRAAGGVSGHAGLFATTHDLAKFCRNLMARRPQLFTKPTLRRMFENQIPCVGGSTCGWFTAPNKMLPGMNSFHRRGIKAFGHTGFTGTSIVIAPQQELFTVMLTNRVYFGRDTPKFQALRRRLHREFAGLCAEWQREVSSD